MTWSIRAAEPGEARRLADFAAMLFRQAYEATHPEPTLSAYLATSFNVERVRRMLEDPASATLIAVAADGSWIGYAELHRGPPTAPTTVLTRSLPGNAPMEIVRFYVDREWHGRGVAQSLMHACEEKARASGCDVLWLQAWQEAAQALRYYEKAGFEVYGTAIFQFGERTDRDFIVARRLTASV